MCCPCSCDSSMSFMLSLLMLAYQVKSARNCNLFTMCSYDWLYKNNTWELIYYFYLKFISFTDCVQYGLTSFVVVYNCFLIWEQFLCSNAHLSLLFHMLLEFYFTHLLISGNCGKKQRLYILEGHFSFEGGNKNFWGHNLKTSVLQVFQPT